MNTGHRQLHAIDPLPIDPYLPEIVSVLRKAGALVLTAPPGAGKTTRIPRALYDAGFAEKGEILILEPRRIAARLAASRVAQELNEKPGETVGYSIRFENVAGPKTRIRFLTEAILARRILKDPGLQGVSTVIIDEFHERHLATDLALAFLKQLQIENPGIKIIVMSATLDAAPIISFLANAQLLSVEGSPFDLCIGYEEKADDRPLHEKVAAGVSRLLRSRPKGDILAFLPGSAEIRRSAEALAPIADRLGFQLFMLHGDLPVSEQSRAIETAATNKVILATNVAETSITIPGIAAVIDSGLARIAGYSAWSGFPILFTGKISKSSAIQRAGRAGRTQTGQVIRLYTRQDYESRPDHETPEIMRTDLSETALMLHGAGVCNISSLSWFESPPKPAIEAAEALLIKLGAIDGAGHITNTGMRMLEFPIHPRLARLIVEGEKSHVADECVLLAAILSERDIRTNARANLGLLGSRTTKHFSGPSDLLELLDRFREAEDSDFNPDQVHSLGLDVRTVHAVRRGQQQIRRILSGSKPAPRRHLAPDQAEEAILIATLSAFPDRVAKRRKSGSRELLLAGGGSAVLSPASVVHDSMFAVAIDAEERKDSNPQKPSTNLIRLASAIEIEWLAGMFPDAISQKIELTWNDRAGRVDEVQRISYGQIPLEEITRAAAPSKEASVILASAALARAVSPFRDFSLLASFQARLALLLKHFPEEDWPDPGDQDIGDMVSKACIGKCSLKELAQLSLIDAIIDSLTNRQRTLLLREAPERIKIKSGRTVIIHYEKARLPWIESRLQDFFGTFRTPAICGGMVPLTIHLLAPNGRAVQVTQDLAGFWEKHYPKVRQELHRRYPKHAWPELQKLTKS
jgi:ATP-dependent helicase HrpB